MAVLEDLRTKTGELLDEGLNTGALTTAEHSWRRGHLVQADSVEALEALVEDLLVTESKPMTLARTSSQITILQNRAYSVPDLGRRSELVTILGSSSIDLTALNPDAELTIELVTVMGDTTVTLPEGLVVRVECTPVMGDCHINPALRSADSLIRITGVVVMGSLRIVSAQSHRRG